ncbi:MAG: DUF177 domain-containing protein, partial [Burkholderiales bacterium]|nr:DUF177 domain-containing protein [Burkholderiales bacterium]
LRAWAGADGRLQGAWPLASMPRLVQSLAGAEPQATASWSAEGGLRPVVGGEPEPWLALQAQAPVSLQCQRCLQPMPQQLEVQRRFRFVPGEPEAERLDEMSEDDVLALPPRLDLMALLEDELILALPLVPRHEGACPQPLPTSALAPADTDPAAAGGESGAPHPFAGLAALTGPGQSGQSGQSGGPGGSSGPAGRGMRRKPGG